MHNRIGFNRLGRKSSHRKALCRNMLTSLIKHGRIETTKAKALEVRRVAEKLLTRAKVDSVHNRRIAAKKIYTKVVLNKLFTEVGPSFAERPGGYTRMLKKGLRRNDLAEMVILELLKDESELSPPKSKKKKVKRGSPDSKAITADVVSSDSPPESGEASQDDKEDTSETVASQVDEKTQPK